MSSSCSWTGGRKIVEKVIYDPIFHGIKEISGWRPSPCLTCMRHMLTFKKKKKSFSVIGKADTDYSTWPYWEETKIKMPSTTPPNSIFEVLTWGLRIGRQVWINNQSWLGCNHAYHWPITVLIPGFQFVLKAVCTMWDPFPRNRILLWLAPGHNSFLSQHETPGENSSALESDSQREGRAS